MLFKSLLPLALATLISAQSTMTLSEALASQNETLSTLNGTFSLPTPSSSLT